jgi:tRNA pseudouridine38-40 synthase
MILIQVEADRFLKQMIRALVGTVVEIGQGKRSSRAMKEILEAADRRAAGYTAPAHGLYLVRVDY